MTKTGSGYPVVSFPQTSKYNLQDAHPSSHCKLHRQQVGTLLVLCANKGWWWPVRARERDDSDVDIFGKDRSELSADDDEDPWEGLMPTVGLPRSVRHSCQRARQNVSQVLYHLGPSRRVWIWGTSTEQRTAGSPPLYRLGLQPELGNQPIDHGTCDFRCGGGEAQGRHHFRSCSSSVDLDQLERPGVADLRLGHPPRVDVLARCDRF